MGGLELVMTAQVHLAAEGETWRRVARVTHRRRRLR